MSVSKLRRKTEVSDSHYRSIEGSENGIEPIQIMEQIARNENLPNVPKMNIILAQKHITRAGLKKGDNWEKDINKAINYLTRAVTGKWVG